MWRETFFDHIMRREILEYVVRTGKRICRGRDSPREIMLIGLIWRHGKYQHNWSRTPESADSYTIKPGTWCWWSLQWSLEFCLYNIRIDISFSSCWLPQSMHVTLLPCTPSHFALEDKCLGLNFLWCSLLCQLSGAPMFTPIGYNLQK